jgi:hypothetical protein
MPSRTRMIRWPPGVQDLGDHLVSQEVAVHQEYPAGEQLRPLADQPGDQGLLAEVRGVRGRAEDRGPAKKVTSRQRRCGNDPSAGSSLPFSSFRHHQCALLPPA